MEIGVYKVQSKAEPDKFLIVHGNDPEKVLEYLLNPLNKGQYPGERLQDHFNKYGEEDLECSLIVPCINNFLASLAVRDMINAEEPYFNGADPIKVLDTMVDEVPEEVITEEVPEVEDAVTEEPETEKAVVKTVKKRRPRK
jgi:hypothetical protein